MQPKTDLIARLEKMATTREWIAQQRLQEAHVSECEGLGTIAKIERQLSQEHAKVAADLRAAAVAVRLVGECKTWVQNAIDNCEYEAEYDGQVLSVCFYCFMDHDTGNHATNCELKKAIELSKAIGEWEGEYGQ